MPVRRRAVRSSISLMDFDRYSTSAYAYWNRSRRLLNDFEQARHQLFYVAYELRCAIEAFLYDYLGFLRDGELPKALEKIYRAKHLRDAIYDLEPDFEESIAFNNIVHAAMGLKFIQIPVPDLDELNSLYGRIGAFMHVQKEAMDGEGSEARWMELEALVKEAQAFMQDLVHPQKSRLQLTADGIELFKEFKAGTKTAEQLEIQVRGNLKRYIAGAVFEL